ncbi:MAG: hypothetical protein R3F20_16735 [Planctomycetota bacterium]
MKLPRVFVVEDNEFDLGLMTDVILCNDLKAVPATGESWLDDGLSALDAKDVVVVDLDLPGERGRRVVERLRSRPLEVRPRIVTLSVDGRAAGAPDVEEVLGRPLDIGGFARAVVRQSREANLD